MALVATFVSTEEGGAPTARLRHHETENGGGDTHVSECLKFTIPIFWRSVQNCTVIGKSLKRVVGNHDLKVHRRRKTVQIRRFYSQIGHLYKSHSGTIDNNSPASLRCELTPERRWSDAKF